jgi:hypothetical protein
VLPTALMVWVQWEENAKTSVQTEVKARDIEAAQSALPMLETVGAFDGEAWYLRSRFESDPAARLKLLERACQLNPTTKNLRALSDEQATIGKTTDALRTLDQALYFDPNNLRTLSVKLKLQDQAGSEVSALDTAKAIIAVEQTPYLQVRALPEYVPTEPLEARVYLAKHEQDQEQRASLLQEALDGYARYKRLTVPQVKRFAQANETYIGETIETAKSKMQDAREVASDLADLYQSLGRSPDAEGVRELAKGLTVD